ncbi:MAG: hypothetical protein A2046_01620 [Bacteroidetes bacterium GWA2_30_7]|nr:MAG: hypothetical protein A2046_01620 [Bacteroidetes bacterium GWA2_30_7]
MSILKILVIIFLVSVFTSNVYCQEKWSLEKCVSYAIENNIQIKQSDLNVRVSKGILNQSKFQILPNLNANANQQYSFGRSIDPYTYEFSDNNIKSNNFSISSSITLFNGLQTINTIRQNNINLLSGIQDVEKLKNDIALNIAAAFLQILYNEDIYQVALLQKDITTQQVERTKKLVEAGSLANGNLLEAESQLATEELQVINAENQLNMSYLNLKQILDLDTVEDFKIDKPEITSPDEKVYLPSVNQVYSEAVTNLPQIKSAEFKVRSSEIGLSIARGKRSPKLTLTGSYGTGYSSSRMLGKYVPTTVTIGQTASGEEVYGSSFIYNTEKYPFNDQIKDNASTSLTFGLSVPIFNNWYVNSGVSNAKISLLNSEYNLELARKQLFKEIQQAHADANAALNKFFASKKAKISIEESFNYTQQKFDVGLVSNLDYNIAKNNLAKSKSDMLQAKYDFIFKTKILDFYRGNQIKL